MQAAGRKLDSVNVMFPAGASSRAEHRVSFCCCRLRRLRLRMECWRMFCRDSDQHLRQLILRLGRVLC